VISESSDAMDMQIFNLPTDFHDEILQSIRVTDNRISYPSSFPHSGIVSGITVVPEPATIIMLGFGGLTLLRRKSRR
jgi:hypothetical protein